MMLEESKFENVLQSLRVRKGKAWTQIKTADELGVSRRTYVGWENGERVPSPRDLKNIAALFSLDTEAEDTLYRAAAQASPKVHNLPFPQNPFFTGRKTYLELLGQFLRENSSVALTQPISISGLGGVGKTQLALEYAHRCYPNVYRAVLWVNAADKSALQRSYDSLAQFLELPERNERELDQRIQAVKRWLETHTNWLLIMDNADDLQLARSFFPEAHHGHILLTTRSQIVGNIASKIEIVEMEPAEGLLFLLRRSGALQRDTPLDTVAADIRESALQLVELLGGHPLALDQAGAYIEETEVSFTDYINLYHEQRQLLLNRRGALECEYSEHPKTVATTFDLCFTKARERHPLATDILHFCAFLQSDAIPEELFQHDDSFKYGTTSFDEGIAALHGYSLIKRNRQEKTLSMHRLVQAVLSDGMLPDLQEQWRECVVRSLNAAFPEVTFENWRRCQRLLPHALVCATWTEDELTPTIRVAELFDSTSIYLLSQGQYSEAETLQVRVLSMYEQHFGVEHPRTGNALNMLAGLYDDQGKYEQAEALYQQALSIQEKLLGVDHLDTAMSLNNLATLYVHQDKVGQAEQILVRVLPILVKLLGAEHPDTATSMYNLAYTYFEQGKDEQAETLYKQVLSIQEKLLGAEHPDTAKSILMMALLYTSQGKNEQAELLYRRVLKIFEKHLGANHPDIAPPLKGLAILLQGQGKHEQAEASYQRALSVQEQRLGATHPYVQETKMDYAVFLRSMGRDAEAASLEVNDEPSV